MGLPIFSINKFKQHVVKILNKEIRKRWSSNYFITTPIFYVNAEPHVGHLYTTLIADAFVRYQKLKNSNIKCRFMVGTDEHGTKVYQSAKANSVSVEEFCNNVSNKYKDLFHLFSVDVDDFVRTTEERHKKAVEAFWNALYSNGHIYKDKYSGWYCVADEMFISEYALDPKVDDKGLRCTLDGHKQVEFLEEINYKFKLSNFQNDLLYWFKNEVTIKPEQFSNELYHLIETIDGIQDISVSRPANRVPWGIPVPGDSSQTIYVWLDALSSYLCSSGYPDVSFCWPPTWQIIGIDILRFHGVFWPAFLLAAGLEPPKQILCHSHWMKDNEKMSKSKGNVIDPFLEANLYTSDGFRYFLLREGVPHSNRNFTDFKVIATLNSELADSFGNLLNRCTGPVINPQQIFPAFSEENFQKYCKEHAETLVNALKELPEIVISHFEEFNFYKGIDSIMSTIHLTNKFFNDQKPWELRKDPTNQNHLNSVLHLSMESLRVCGILLQPIIPNTCKALLDKLSVPKHKRNFSDVQPYSLGKTSETVTLSPQNVTLFSKITDKIR